MMNRKLAADVHSIPVVDIHSHIERNRMYAEDLDSLLFYHMLRYPLLVAGFDKDQLWKREIGSEEERSARFDRWLELWPQIENTSFAWILKTCLKDLYGFSKPLSRASFPELKKKFSELSVSNDFAFKVMDRHGIEFILTSKFYGLGPAASGSRENRILFTNEMGLGGGIHEYRGWPERFKWMEEKSGGQIGNFADLKRIVKEYYEKFDWSDKHAYVSWVSSIADFKPVSDAIVDRIIGRIRQAEEVSVAELEILDAAMIRATCLAIRGKTRIFQLVYGCQFVTAGYRHPEARAKWDYANGLGHLCDEFPDIHFNVLNGYEPHEPDLCSLAVAYENLSLGGFWWHTFYPSVMKAAWHRRLEIVPVSRLQGFFSDGYCVDWVYGRLALTRKVLSEALSEKVELGYYSAAQAVRIAEDVLRIQPKKLFGIGLQ